MEYGDKGPAVLALQQQLKTLKLYKGRLDSDFGPKLAAACAAYTIEHLAEPVAPSRVATGPVLPTSANIPRWLTIAQGELGQTEIAGAENNPRIIEYHATTTYKATNDETPWCASYVAWCLEQAGIKSTRSARARSYESWGQPIYDHRKVPPGAIVVFWRGANRSVGSGHVGFYVGGDPSSGKIALLGGNQGDQVKVGTYRTDKLICYRWPTGVLYPLKEIIREAHALDVGAAVKQRWV